jgi:hypothetical protein
MAARTIRTPYLLLDGEKEKRAYPVYDPHRSLRRISPILAGNPGKGYLFKLAQILLAVKVTSTHKQGKHDKPCQ